MTALMNVTLSNFFLFREVNYDMRVGEELLDLQSLKDQTSWKNEFASICSAVNDIKLSWKKNLELLLIVLVPWLVSIVY